MGSSCSSVMTTDLLSLSYMRIGVLGFILSACSTFRWTFGTHLAELPDELSTHSARAGRRANICRHSYRSNVASLRALRFISIAWTNVSECLRPHMLHYRRPNRCSLGTSAYGIRCILNIGALHNLSTLQQQCSTNSEVRVRAWSGDVHQCPASFRA